MAIYECVSVDTATKDCTAWQLVEPKQPESYLTKEQTNELTVAIVGFMVFVWIWLQIKKSI